MPIIIKPLQVVDRTNAILASNPLAWYRFFDEQSQSTLLFDQISNNFSATVTKQGISYQQNIIGDTIGGIVTDGISSFASIPSGSLPHLTTGGAILLNLASRHPSNSTIAQTRVLASFAAGSTFLNIEIPANQSLLRFNLNDQVFLSGPSAARFTNGSANTVLLSTSQTGNSSVYVNGDFIGTIATRFNPVVALFGRSPTGRFAAGGFCEVVIWGTAIPMTLVNSLTGNVFQTIPDNVIRTVNTTREDTVAGTLAEKIIEGTGVILTEVNSGGGDIKLQVGADFDTVGKLVDEAIEVSLVANVDYYVNFSNINSLSNIVVLLDGNEISVDTTITAPTQAKINSGVSLDVTIVGIGSK